MSVKYVDIKHDKTVLANQRLKKEEHAVIMEDLARKYSP